MRIDASWAANIVNGALVGPPVVADGIGFDTRTLAAGQAFVALIGDSDGHQFLEDAARRGAAWALVARGRSIDSLTCVEVDDTLVALGLLGHACRQRLRHALGRVVGITGSAGKTTAKNFTAAVLAAGFPGAVAARASLNNDIGVPVTLVNAPEDAPAVVLEMGMRGFGEIERLCRLAQPDVGVVTIVGDAHSDRVGGIEGVTRAKSEIVSTLPPEGIAVLNFDDERVRTMASLHSGRTVTYGSSQSADICWVIESRNDDGCARVRFETSGARAHAQLSLPGDHMAVNAAAAVAVGIALGVALEISVGALADVVPEAGRVQWRSVGGLRVLDDSYNANSASMAAALHTIAAVSQTPKYAVLGAMAEIEDAENAHRHVADVARELGIEVLPLDTPLYGSAPLGVDDIVSRLRSASDAVVLVKGSRVARTERVIERLLAP